MTSPRLKTKISELVVQRALTRVLRPFVRLSLVSGLTFPVFSAIVRRLYIDVAQKELALPDKQQTDSRISLLTGIHRKDVSKLRFTEMPANSVPAPVSRTSRIVARWLADPRYCDDNDTPKPLPRAGLQGEASFDNLVRDVTRDLHPRAVLDEWLDRGIASLDDKDLVHLNNTAIIPDAADDTRHYYFTRNLHDHATASVENIMSETPPFFERAVHYNNISQTLSQKLTEISKSEAMELLLRLNRIANEEVKTDPGGQERWIAGIYIFTAAEMQSDPSSHLTDGERDR